MAVSTFNFAKFGVFNAHSFGGVTLFGHVTYLIRPGDGAHAGVHARTVERIARKIEPIAASLRRQTFPHELWRQTTDKYNELHLVLAVPMIIEDLKRHDRTLQGVEKREKTVAAAMAIALSVIRAHPWEYARHVLANYYGMWQGFLVDYGSIPAHAATCYANMRELHSSGRELFERFTDLTYLDDAAAARRNELRADTKTALRYGWTLFLMKREMLLLLALFLSIGFILLSLRAPKDPMILLLSYASFQLNAYLAYLATITAAIERYSVPFTPVLFLILFGTLIVCTPTVARFVRRRIGGSGDVVSV